MPWLRPLELVRRDREDEDEDEDDLDCSRCRDAVEPGAEARLDEACPFRSSSGVGAEFAFGAGRGSVVERDSTDPGWDLARDIRILEPAFFRCSLLGPGV